MTELFNLKSQTQLRKNLRNQSHDIGAEKRFWWKLRNKNLGYRFRRQFGVRNYIVDFYCPKLKLVIEIDGGTHKKVLDINKDKIRQDYLEGLGLVIKRYNNQAVYENLGLVLDDILKICKKLDNK